MTYSLKINENHKLLECITANDAQLFRVVNEKFGYIIG